MKHLRDNLLLERVPLICSIPRCHSNDMIKNNHHYVPRFHLKKFAVNRHESNPKSIALYNIIKDVYAPTSNLYNQCSRHKFYGHEDDVENSLAILEGSIAKTFESVINNPLSSLRKPDIISKILLGVSLQWSRTYSRSVDYDMYFDAMVESLEIARDDIIKHLSDDLLPSNIGSSRPRLSSPIIETLRIGVTMYPILADMGIVLLKAPLGHEFIISDNPVSLYNTYAQNDPSLGGVGLGNAGLQIFLPLTPELCIHLFDPMIYDIITRPRSGLMHIRESDVRKINGLQYINAHSNLFHTGIYGKEYFDKLKSWYSSFRDIDRVRSSQFTNTNNHLDKLTVISNVTPNILLELSFCTLSRFAKDTPARKRDQLYRPHARKVIADMRPPRTDESPEGGTFRFDKSIL